MKTGQKKRLERLLAKVQAARYKLRDDVDNAAKPTLTQYMPPYSVPGANKIIDSVKEAEEKVNLALLKGHGEFENLMELMKQRQDSANNASARIEGQVRDAMAQINEGGDPH